jgi:hypothetical protein
VSAHDTPQNHVQERTLARTLHRCWGARKERDSTRVAALRSVLSAIDNAEVPDTVMVAGRTAGMITGAVAGLGAAALRAEMVVLTGLLGDV